MSVRVEELEELAGDMELLSHLRQIKSPEIREKLFRWALARLREHYSVEWGRSLEGEGRDYVPVYPGEWPLLFREYLESPRATELVTGVQIDKIVDESEF